MLNLKGLATGIGSLPHKDADLALDLIFKYLPQAPFWPQLPKRDVREGMIAQFSEKLPCLKLGKEGLAFDAKNKEKELENFYEHIIAADVDYFKISPDYAAGIYAFYQRLKKADLKNIQYIKCQVTGPLTFAASIKDEAGKSLLHDPVFMQVITKALAMKALWQIEFLQEFRKQAILFIDEPYLGCFGSAYTPINREDVVGVLSELTQELASKRADVLLGVHCCGNTDWSIFTDIDQIDIISFDAFSFLERFLLYSRQLLGFLERGGVLCWGMIPTQEFSGKEDPEMLVGRIRAGIEILVKKGLPGDLLSKNILLSPACGLGTLDIAQSEAILKLLSETANYLRNKNI